MWVLITLFLLLQTSPVKVEFIIMFSLIYAGQFCGLLSLVMFVGMLLRGISYTDYIYTCWDVDLCIRDSSAIHQKTFSILNLVYLVYSLP